MPTHSLLDDKFVSVTLIERKRKRLRKTHPNLDEKTIEEMVTHFIGDSIVWNNRRTTIPSYSVYWYEDKPDHTLYSVRQYTYTDETTGKRHTDWFFDVVQWEYNPILDTWVYPTDKSRHIVYTCQTYEQARAMLHLKRMESITRH